MTDTCLKLPVTISAPAADPTWEAPAAIASSIALKNIRLDGGTQPRKGINADYLQELIESIQSGTTPPPVTLYFDGEDYWLADGFHRHHAYQALDRLAIPADIRQGTLRDAKLHSAGANASHGLRRTSADKRRSVVMLLEDPEWSQWSNREIARRCGVDEKTVRNIREELVSGAEIPHSSNSPIDHAPAPKSPPPPAIEEVRSLYRQVGQIVRIPTPSQPNRFQVQNEKLGTPFPLCFGGAKSAAAWWERNGEEVLALVDRRGAAPVAAADQSIERSQPQRFEVGDRVRTVANQDDDFTVTEFATPDVAVVEDEDEQVFEVAIADLIAAPESVATDGRKESKSRIANDFYPTRDAEILTGALLKVVDIQGQVFECCAGDLAIANLFDGCITNDLFDYEGCKHCYNGDAADSELWEMVEADGGFDWCSTNPPFHLASKILPLAFEHARVGVAFLLRLTYLEPCGDRAAWLQENADHFCKIIPVNPRPKFRNDTDGTDKATVAWFVWRKDFSWKALGLECPFVFASNWRSAA